MPVPSLNTHKTAVSKSVMPGIVGSVSRYARVPSKFDIPIERQDEFLAGCAEIVEKVNKTGGISNYKIPDAIIVAALEASSGSLCPGFLGSRRPALEARLARLFGEKSWETQHIIAGRCSPPAAALGLYEKGYMSFFRSNPKTLEWLCKNFSNVYDTVPSNIVSGENYTIQESLEKGAHLHDIAIRRAVQYLGGRFEGERLLQVRGPKSEGASLSPGVVPFHKPELIPKNPVPNAKPWWDPGSIEDFYQRTRRIVVYEFDDGSALSSHLTAAHERTETLCARIASRCLLRLIPTITKAEVGLAQLNDMPWMIDRNSFPLDPSGLPRSFTKAEIFSTISALKQQLEYFFRRGNDSTALMTNDPWTGFDHSERFIKALEKWSRDEVLNSTESGWFPDFAEMKSWQNAMPLFWKHTYLEGKKPLFLARDAWVIMEYVGYRSDLIGQDRQHSKRSVYIPGTQPRASLRKNERSNCKPLEEIVETLTGFAIQARENSQTSSAPDAIHAEYVHLVNQWLEKSESEPNSIWLPIYNQIAEQFPNGIDNLVVVDSDGTGKTAQFIASMLEHFAKKTNPEASVSVLLGGMKGTADAPPIFVRNLASMYGFPVDASSGRHLPDSRWPFTFAGYNPDPRFNVEKHPGRYLLLMWRAMQIYNQAVSDAYPSESVH